MSRYVALLRGINVGGKNLIKMTALQACFEEHGFGEVSTYIQSGNVLFAAREASAAKLTARIEGILSAAFGYRASVVLLTHAQMRAVVDGAPAGFGARPSKLRYDVWYLMPPLKAAAAIAAVPKKEGVDQVFPGPGVLYTTRLVAKATQSRLVRITAAPLYQSLTIRNWNTTRELLRRMDGG